MEKTELLPYKYVWWSPTRLKEFWVNSDSQKTEKLIRRAFVGLASLTIVQSLIFLVLTVSGRTHLKLPRQMYNGSVCCGQIRHVMELRIQNEMTKQYFKNRQSNPKLLVGEWFVIDCEWERIKAPKAKLVGMVDSVPSYIVQGHSKVRWNKNGHTFTENKCIHLELEGEIFIKRPGYYIVSSTLTGNTTGMNITTKTFSHSLNLLSHKFGTTGALMQRKVSIKESNDLVFISIMSAVFKLHMYDRISVSVSNPKVLALNNSNDHFTAYYTYDMA